MTLAEWQARWQRGEKLRAYLEMLPTVLERDTMLMPDVAAEDVVREVECFFRTELPKDLATRLEARAHYMYSHSQQFHKDLNCPACRENLKTYMRVWLAKLILREHYSLSCKLPGMFSWGYPLPMERIAKNGSDNNALS